MRLFSLLISLAEFQKCIVWYSSIEYFSQYSKFNFCFQKDTKTTVVLFILSITVHVVVFISFYCNCWAVIILKYITKIQHTDSAKIQIILSDDKKCMSMIFLHSNIPWSYKSEQRIGCDKKHRNFVRCSLLSESRT